MKVLVLGDTHFRSKDFYRRLNLYREILTAHKDEISYVIHTGDLFDNVSIGDRDVPTPDMVSEISKVHSDLKLPLYLVCGNHDRVSIINALRVFDGDKYIIPIYSPGVVRIGNTPALFIPWTSGDKAAKSFVKETIKKNSEGIQYCFAHMDTLGANHNYYITEDEDKSQWCFKREDFCNIPTFAGHIHTPQALGCVEYIGTIEQLNFSEEGNLNKYLVLDLLTGEKVYHEVKNGQKYYTIKSTDELPPEGSHVRFYGEENPPKALRDKYLSWRLVKKQETVERKEVVEVKTAEVTAQFLYDEYCRLSGEVPIECKEELAELNTIIAQHKIENTGGIEKFNWVEVENISRWKEKEKFTFTDGINLIYGPSGSSKTVLLESLYAAFYGSFPYTGRSSLNSLLNSPTGALVASGRASDGSDHTVERIISVTGSKGRLDGGNLTLKTALDQQCEKLFGSKETAGRVCLVDQKLTTDLVDRSEAERMLALRDILGLDYFYELEDYITKQRQGQQKEQQQQDHIEAMGNQISARRVEQEKLIQDLSVVKTSLEELQLTLAVMKKEETEKYSAEAFRHVKALGNLRDFSAYFAEKEIMKGLEELWKKQQQTLGEIEREAKYSCEKCGYKKSNESSLAEYKELYATTYGEWAEKNKAMGQKYSMYKVNLRDMELAIPFVQKNFATEEIDEFYTLAKEFRERLNATNTEHLALVKEVGYKSGQLNSLPRLISQMETELTTAKENLEKTKRWNHLAQVFGKKGVCNYIIAGAVNEIQKLVTELLAVSDLPITLELSTQKESKTGFSEALQVLMVKDDGKKYDARSASGGELNIIRMVLRLAISRYLQSQGVNYKVLLLDEISANLDNAKTRLLFNLILTQKEYFKQIICVSHSDALLEYARSVIYL